MKYNTATLNNGLRVVYVETPSPVAYLGIAVAAGTRHEQKGEEGLAHFAEHMAFKGTCRHTAAGCRRRTAVQMVNRIEGVGGELNAFTNKEDTVFYSAISCRHVRRAAEVLCDMVFYSSCPQAEVEKESLVVCDEIESYEDSPAELICDEIENILFEGHPLGHNILGQADHVRRFSSDDVLAFMHRHYRPANSVFFLSGQTDFKALVRLLGKATPAAPPDGGGDPPALSPQATMPTALPATLTVNRATHQAHVMLAARAFAANDERRWPLFLLNNLLGGPGMNSRLNLSLREKRALVYTVESAVVCYGDTGQWSTYLGCDAEDVDKCVRLVKKELRRLADNPLSPRQLRAAKQQMAGQLAIASDNREQQTLDMARSFLHYDVVRELDEVLKKLDAVTARQLQDTAGALFRDDRLSLLVYC